MTRPAAPSATSAIALETSAKPTHAMMATGALGSAGSNDALARLNAAMIELKAMAIQPMLQRAMDALRGEDHATATEWSLKALAQDERSGVGWYLLGIARERAGDFSTSVQAYESALKLLPDHAEIANDLGRLAFRMGMPSQAEQLFRHFLGRFPDHPEGANNLACAIRDQHRAEEAIDFLRPAIVKHPETPMLWNTMGTVVAELGDFPNARVFFEEALRLQPQFPKATYNLGNARLALGDAAGALEACEAALAQGPPADERQMMRLARSTILMTLGRVAEGWDEYEARLEPDFNGVTIFQAPGRRWAPGVGLAGRSILVFGEQGLGDEILFANLLPDLVAGLGPSGRLVLAVEPRLVALFQRTFPQAQVGPHATHLAAGRLLRTAPFLGEDTGVDLWTPMASLLREFRPTVESFPAAEGFLVPDPARVDHWREVLKTAPPGPKVGLLWKSAIKAQARQRYYSAFDAWKPVLAVPGVSFVNLQYGDCAEELAQAREQMGVEIWTPPGIDLKQDLDDIAALSYALDLVVGCANATLNIAAACGAPNWLIGTPGAWTMLGTDRFPWYPQTRVFMTPGFGDWDPVMAQMADALAAFASAER
jgi:tetratricopeptide (TPR) repeat protein